MCLGSGVGWAASVTTAVDVQTGVQSFHISLASNDQLWMWLDRRRVLQQTSAIQKLLLEGPSAVLVLILRNTIHWDGKDGKDGTPGEKRIYITPAAKAGKPGSVNFQTPYP